MNPSNLPDVSGLPDGYYSDAELAWLLGAIRRRQPKRIVEIGTCMGRSAIAIARAMRPTAHLWCIDIWPDARLLNTFKYAVEQAGLAQRITAIRQPSIAAARAWRTKCGVRNADCGMEDRMSRKGAETQRKTQTQIDADEHSKKCFCENQRESASTPDLQSEIRNPKSKIDLLHIDGDHRSLGVYLDIREWLPSLSPDGIFIGHDWNLDSVRFGVMQAQAEGLLGEIGVSDVQRNGKPATWWALPGTTGTWTGTERSNHA